MLEARLMKDTTNEKRYGVLSIGKTFKYNEIC
jgi:hypothetical protein